MHYIIQSEEFPFIPTQTSTAELVSEFGIFGVFLDPVILQVPEGASGFVATFNDGSGPQSALITAVPSFQVEPGLVVAPEPGEQLVILDFPSGFVPADNTNFNFSLEFEVPELADVYVKVMFAGKVELLDEAGAGTGEVFYLPMLPCFTDFADVPAIRIPVSDFPDDLVLSVGAHLEQGGLTCDGKVYDLTGAGNGGNPSIAISKTPDSQDILSGADATFTITVTNTGDVDFTEVTVVDPAVPTCGREIGPLAVAAVFAYDCTAENVVASFTNVATVTAEASDGAVVMHDDTAEVTVLPPPNNGLLDCSQAIADPDLLWPANHRFIPVYVLGVADPNGDAVIINIDAIWQDEPVNGTGDGNFAPDGMGVDSSTAWVRAERAAGGNGRVYHIFFTASDGNGGTCSGVVNVGVPRDMGRNRVPVDDGPLYDSTNEG